MHFGFANLLNNLRICIVWSVVIIEQNERKETKTSFRRKPSQRTRASSSPVRQSISLLQTFLFGIQIFDRQWKLLSLHSVTQENYKCKSQDHMIQQPHIARELFKI